MINYMAVFLIAHCIMLLINVKMIGAFYEKRIASQKFMVLSFSLIYFLSFLTHFLIKDYLSAQWLVLEMLLDFAWYFIITLNYESTTFKRAVVTISVFMISSVSNILASSLIFMLLPNIPNDSDEYLLIGSIVAISIAYLFAAILSRFKSIKKNSVVPRAALVVPITVVLMLLGFIFLLIASVFKIGIIEKVITVFFIFFMGAPVFLVFYLYDTLSTAYESKMKMTLHAQEKEYYFTQCQLMQESVEQMNAFKHDMKSQLASLKDYAAKGKTDDTERYLNSLLDDVERSSIYSDTGNIAFDSIINYKFKNIKISDIKLDFRISVPVTLNIEIIDIVTILGNLLDNALDAIAKVCDKEIKLDIAFEKGGLYIKLDNSFNGEIKYSDGQQIITSKNEYGHGYGLKNIRQSVEKYNGYLQQTHSGNIFSTVVFLYVDEV